MPRIRKPITAPYKRTRLESHLDETAALRDAVEELTHELAQRDEMIDELLGEIQTLSRKVA